MSGQFYQPGAGMRYRTAAYPANPYVPTSPNGNFGAGSGRGGVLPGGYSNDKLKRPSRARRLKTIGIALLVCLTPVLLFFASAILQAYRTQRAPDHPSEELYETKSGKQKFGSIFNQPDVFLSVVVPAYNEEKRMKDGVSEMLDYLTRAEAANADFDWELILVDDGSKDATYQTAMDQFVLSASSPPEGRVRVLKSWSNGGKGAAVRKGVLRARGQYVLMADADGATSFADVEALLEALTGHRGPPPVPVTAGAIPPNRPGGRGVDSGPRQPWRDRGRSPFARKGARRHAPAAQGKGRTLLEAPEQPVGTAAVATRGIVLQGRGVALGSRSVSRRGGTRGTSDASSVHRSALRRVAQWGFHTALRLLLGAGGEVQDTQCGFKLFTRLAAAELFTSLHIERWAFDVELVYLATRLAIPMAEVPVTWHEVAGSKLDVKSASVQMLRDIVVIRACYSLGIWSSTPSPVRGLPVPGGLDPSLAQAITGGEKEGVLPSVAELLANMAQQEAVYARQRAYARKWAAARGAYQGMEGGGRGEGQEGEGEEAAQGPEEDNNVPAASTLSPAEGDAGSAPAADETLPSPASAPGSPPLHATPLRMAEGEGAGQEGGSGGGSESSSTPPAEPREGDIVIVESGEGGGGAGGEGEGEAGQGASPQAGTEGEQAQKR